MNVQLKSTSRHHKGNVANAQFEARMVLQSLFGRDKPTLVNISFLELSIGDISLMMSACAFELNVHNDSPFCHLFTLDEFKTYDEGWRQMNSYLYGRPYK